MDFEKIINVTNTFLGINFGIALYLAYKSFVLFYQKRNTFRSLVLLAELCMALSSGWNLMYNLIITATCEGIIIAGLAYGLFYCFIISIGFFRLWALSNFKKIYLLLMICGVISIATTTIGLCKSKRDLV